MNINENVIKFLINDARKAFKRGEIPVSAVIVDGNGKVISHSFNCRQNCYDVLGHAEIAAIRKAESKLKDWRLNGYSMYVSLEPCNMCSMVIKESRLDNVFYFLPKKSDESDINISINKSLIDGYVECKQYFNNLLTSFFDNKR